MNNDPNPIVEDWGQITSAAVTFDDYGSVAEVWTSYEVWTTEYLYVGAGTLFELGNGLERQLAPYVGSGTVRFDGSGSVVRGSAISVGGIISFFDQESENLGGVDGFQTLYDDNGVVADIIPFTTQNWGIIGSTVDFYQDATFASSYNLSSVYSEQEADFNYGLLSENFDEIIDYDSILIYSEYYDYGSVNNSVSYTTLNPFGLVDIYSVEVNSNTNSYVGSGNIIIPGVDASIAFIKNPVETTALFNFSNSSEDIRSKSFVGSGFLYYIDGSTLSFTESTDSSIQLFNVSGSALVAFSRDSIENTILFRIGGEGIIQNPLQAYITGSGLLEVSTDGCVERNTESYNDSSVVLYNWGDVSSIATAAEDYENPLLPWNTGSEEFGFIFNSATQNLTPFGEISAFGNATESNAESYNESSVFKDPDYGLISDDTNIGIEVYGNVFDLNPYPVDYLTIDIPTSLTTPYGGYTFFGGASEVFVSDPQENTILFNISGAALSKVPFQSWTGSGNIDIFGNSDNSETDAFVGSGSIVVFDSGITSKVKASESTILFNLSGAASYSETDTEVGSGSVGFVSGAAEVFGANPPENTQLFRIDGNGVYSETDVEIGSGSITFFSSAAEVYGPNPTENTQLFNLSGSATYIEVDAEVGSGFIVISGEAGTDRLRASESTILFSLSGSATEKNTESYNESADIQYDWGLVSEFATESEDYEDSIPVLPWITGPEDFGSLTDATTENIVPYGSIVIFGSAIEANTESYNESSIFDNDYGFITDQATLIDNGLITDLNPFIIDYQSLEETAVSGIPYGEIISTGSASTSEIATYTAIGSGDIIISGAAKIVSKLDIKYSGSGSIVAFGDAIESETDVEVGSGSFRFLSGAAEVFSANTPENTQLFNLSGAASYSETDTEVGSGSVGFVSGAAEVFGANPPENIQLFIVSGTASYSETDSEVGSGFVRFISGAAEVFGINPPENIQLFRVSGDASYSETDAEVGSGSINVFGASSINFSKDGEESTILFSLFGSATEKNTESYNESSDVQYDWGLVSEFATESEDYEDSIPTLPWVIGPEDFGAVADVATGTINPFGSVVVFGSAFESNTESYNESSVFDADYGSIQDSAILVDYGFTDEIPESINYGLLDDLVVANIPFGNTAFTGSADVAFSRDAIENTQLFVVSGVATIRTKLELKYSGSGSIRFYSEAVEIFSANPPENTQLFRVSGDAIYTETDAFIGSGSVGFVSGAAEVFGANPPENIQLFTVSGDATYRETDVEIGSGFARFISGAAEIFSANPQENTQLFVISGNAATAEFATYTKVASGSISVFGAAVYKETDAEVGSGSIVISGAAGTDRVRASDSTILFSLFGSATEKNTESYNESADIQYDWGLVSEFATESEDYEDSIPVLPWITSSEDLGSLSDSTTQSILPYGSITIFGSAIEANTESYNESSVFDADYGSIQDPATIISYGFVDEIGVNSVNYGLLDSTLIPDLPYGQIISSGTATSREIATYTAIGSGSIVISGEAGTDRVRKSDSTILFRSSGDATHSETDVFVGSGQTVFSGTAPTKLTSFYEFVGQGSSNFFGSATHKETDAFVGSGSIVISGDAGTDRVRSSDSTILFNISGNATHSETDVFVGSGVEFISGVADSNKINTFNGSGSIVLSGNVSDSETDVYEGSGQIILSGAARIVSRLDIRYRAEGTAVFFGDAVDSETDVFVGSGSVGFVSGAAEVFGANPPETTQLFNVSGIAAYSETDAEVGSGFARFISGAAEVFSANPQENTQLFNVSGIATYSETDVEVGSGFARFISGAAEIFSANPQENTQLFVASGNALTAEIATYTKVGSGSVTAFGSAAYSETDREIGSGSIGFVSGAAEVFGANPPENTQLFNVSGAASYSETDAEVGSGFIRFISGAAEVFSANPQENTQLFNVSGAAAYSETDREIGSGTLTFSDSSALVIGVNPPESTQLFSLSGAAFYSETDAFNGSGFIVVFGDAAYSETDVVVGSGQISINGNAIDSETEVFAGSGLFRFSDVGAEVFGANPPENIQLFNVSGAATYSETDTEVGSGSIVVFGSAAYSETDVEVGSGSVGFVSGAAEVFGANPPESIQLFNVSGAAVYSETAVNTGSGEVTLSGTALTAEFAVYTAVASGTIILSGSAETKEIAVYQDYITSGEVSLSGVSVSSFAPNYNGSGSLFAVSGAAESFGANPPETTQLFEISGAAETRELSIIQEIAVGPQYVFSGAASDVKKSHAYTEFAGVIKYTNLSESKIKHTESYVGSGVISTVSGSAEVFGANPSENTQLFVASGSADTRETNLYQAVGSGVIKSEGFANVVITKQEVGFGSISISGGFVIVIRLGVFGSGVISALSGAAEVYGPNPQESTQLFNLSGSASTSERNSYIAVGSGESVFTGSLSENNTESYLGSGSLTITSGAAEVYGPNPPENTQLFDIFGNADYRKANSEVGFVYIESNGASTSNITSAYEGQGNISITGKQTSVAEFKHRGAGSLFAVNGAAEVFGANPVEQTLLYTFEGSAKDTHTERYSGSGSISTTGNAIDNHSESYVGFGVVSSVSGAADVFGANPPESIQLFIIDGSAVTSKSQKQSYTGIVDTEISGTSEEKKSIPFTGFGVVGIYPSSEEKNTESYVGDGSISSIGGSAIAKGSNPEEDTSLYQISGSADSKFIASFVTSGSITLQGNSEEKNTEGYIGSGQIVVSGTTSGQYGIVTITDTIIFNFVGNAKTRVRFAPVCETINYTYGDNNAVTEVRSFDPPSLFVSIF